MTNSGSVTDTTTFTRTHAVHIAAKVATDLKRMQRFYGDPSDEWIQKFQAEAVELLNGGYMGTVIYGFIRYDRWVEPTLSYTARDLLEDTRDDDPGRIRPGSSTEGASFSSYLTYNSAWRQLSPEHREEFTRRLPFQRSAGPAHDINGSWSKDLTYSANSCALDRAILRTYS